jgi:hypothetical protein
MVGMALVTTVPSKALTTRASNTAPVAIRRAVPGRVLARGSTVKPLPSMPYVYAPEGHAETAPCA